MAQVTLISGLTVPEEYLPAISQWASGAVDTQIDQSLPLGIKLVISLLGHAANREQDREFKLEMLQAGASYALTLMEDWLRESGDDMDETLRESLRQWYSRMNDMVQELEDAKAEGEDEDEKWGAL